MSARFQLDDFSMLKLSVGFRRAFKDSEPVEPSQEAFSFDFDIQSHKEDARRYRMVFRMQYTEIDDEEEQVGYKIEAHIMGALSVDQDMSEDEKLSLVPANGVSVLYGALRGIVAQTTGTFAGGKLVLPTVMPHEIVKQVLEGKKKIAEAAEGASV